MEGRCPKCGGEADVSLKGTWKETGTLGLLVLLILGSVALGLLAQAWGPLVGLLLLSLLGVVSAAWEWLRVWWGDMTEYTPHGTRIATEGEQRQKKQYRKQRAKERAAEEIEAAYRKDPKLVRIKCRTCRVVRWPGQA
jgi:hypothetical protein